MALPRPPARRFVAVVVTLLFAVGMVGAFSSLGTSGPAPTPQPQPVVEPLDGVPHVHDTAGHTHLVQPLGPTEAAVANSQKDSVWQLLVAVGFLLQFGIGGAVLWSIKRLSREQAETVHTEKIGPIVALIAKLEKRLDDHSSDDLVHPGLIRAWEERRDSHLKAWLQGISAEIRSATFEAAREALSAHDKDPQAHRVAAEKNHAAIEDDIAALKATLNDTHEGLALLTQAHNNEVDNGNHQIRVTSAPRRSTDPLDKDFRGENGPRNRGGIRGRQ